MINKSLIEIQAGYDEPMEDDLTWLARNVHVWLDSYTFVIKGSLIGGKSSVPIWFEEDDILPNKPLFDRTQWLQRRAELQNKPSWDDAPEWANWLAQDSNGIWFFYSHECTPSDLVFESENEELIISVGVEGSVLGDWRKTLEMRPESKPDQIPQPSQPLQYRPEDVAFNAMDQMCGPDAYHRINHSEQHIGMVGRKFDSDKPRMDLIPPHAEKLMAEVLTFGAKKYSPENWRKVPDLINRYTAAAMRHINDYRSGNSVDSETGIHHLAHAMCCLAFIIENDILSEVERHAENNNPAPASQ